MPKENQKRTYLYIRWAYKQGGGGGGLKPGSFNVGFYGSIFLLVWLCYDPKWWKENGVGVDLGWGGGGVDRRG